MIFAVAYVGMIRFINSYPSPQLLKEEGSMVVMVVGIVTFAQPQQEVQVQFPPIDKTKQNNYGP